MKNVIFGVLMAILPWLSTLSQTSGNCSLGSVSASSTAVCAGGSVQLSAILSQVSCFQSKIIPVGNSNFFPTSIKKDGNNAIYLGIGFTGSVQVGGSTFNSLGGRDVLLCKFNSCGTFLWAVQGGSVGNEDNIGYQAGKGIAIDQQNDVYMIVRYNRAFQVIGTNGAVFNASYTSTSNGNHQDGALVKLNSNGVIQWGATINGSSNDGMESVVIDPQGNVVVGAGFNGCCPSSFTTTVTGPQNSATINSFGSNYGSGSLIKFNSSGRILWTTGLFNRDAGIAGITTDSQGNIYATGSFRSWSNGAAGQVRDASGALYSLFNPGIGLGYLYKLNSNGIWQWGVTFGNNGDGVSSLTSGTDVAIDQQNQLWLTGHYAGAAPTFYTTNGSNLGLGSSNGYSSFLAQYSLNGAALGVQAYQKTSGENTFFQSLALQGQRIGIVGNYSGGNQGGTDLLYIESNTATPSFSSPKVGGGSGDDVLYSIEPYGQDFLLSGSVSGGGNFESTSLPSLASSFIWLGNLPASSATWQWDNGSTDSIRTVSPNQTTTYSCTFSNAGNTCSTSITVQVIPATVLQTSAVLCDGDTLTFGALSITTSGIYSQVFTSSLGCDSTVQLTVNVVKPTENTVFRTICEGDSSFLKDEFFSTTGSYSKTFLGSNGCDSVVTLQLTVLPKSSSTTVANFCSGGTYDWNGSTYSAGGTYTASFPNSVGCDSTATLILNEIQPQFDTIFASICPRGSYDFDGSTLKTPGTYVATLKGALGCDSTVTLILSPRLGDTTYFSASICEGSEYTLDGNTYREAGEYELFYRSSEGCDSVVYFTLNVLPASNTLIQASICSGSSYVFQGSTYNTSGTYSTTFVAQNGCDSVVTLDLTVNPFISSNISASICAGSTYAFGGRILSTTGTYVDSLQTSNGCDSVVTLDLTVNPVISSNLPDSLSACGNSALLQTGLGNQFSFLWNTGDTSSQIQVSTSGWYQVRISQNGCDGFDSVLVDFLQANIIQNDTAICGPKSVVLSMASSVGNSPNFSLDFPNNAQYSGNAEAICNSNLGGFDLTGDFTIEFWIKAENSYYWHLMGKNTFGNNSQGWLLKKPGASLGIGWTYVPNEFSFHNFSFGQWEHVAICFNDASNQFLYFKDGQLIASQNRDININPAPYNFVIGHELGTGNWFDGKLDNLRISNTSRYSSAFVPQNTFITDGNTVAMYDFNEGNGNVAFDLSGNNRHLSLINTNFSSDVPSGSKVSSTSYLWSTGETTSSISVTPSQTTTYYCTVSNGLTTCTDSVVISVNTPISSNISVSICAGSTYAFGGRNVGATGTYVDTLQTATGCDSLVTLDLTVNPVISSNISASICAGSSYAFGGRNIGATGTYVDTLQTATGCDSLVTLDLTVNPVISSNITASICAGSTYAFGGRNIGATGTYVDTLQTATGCDSLVFLQLTVNQPASILISTSRNPIICSGSTINIIASAGYQNYLWNTGASTSTISVGTAGNYSVSATDLNGCLAQSNTVSITVQNALPARPISIVGELNPCGFVGNGNTLTYSTNPIPNALSYTWLLTDGIAAVGRADSNVITVTYPAGFSTGQIRVTPVNACGNGLARAIYPKLAPISTVPVFTQSVTSVCDIRGTAATATYSIQPISGCSSYQWTLPSNTTLVSGQGTTSIQVTFGSSFTSGSISVIGISSCGNSPSKSVGIALLLKPEISGFTSLCPGSQETYSISVVPGAIRYRFNLPSGLVLVSQNLNTAVIRNNGSFVSGTLGAQVQTTNCGWSQPGALALNTVACRSVANESLSIAIYPNPSRGEFQLQLGTMVSNVQVSLYASDGRLVKREMVSPVQIQTLNYQNLAEGLYHLEVVATDLNQQVVRHLEKIMIQR